MIDDLHGGSAASYAIRFAAGFDGVLIIIKKADEMKKSRK